MIQRIRGRGFKLYAYVLWALAGVVAFAAVINGGISELLWTLPPIALFVAFGWAVFWNPRLELSAGGIRVVNIVRQFDIPWDDFDYTERRWGLYLYTRSARKISVWAVPSSTGIFDNSWINGKLKRDDAPVNWESGEEVTTRTIGLATVAEEIERYAEKYRSDRRFREDRKREAPDWPRTTEVHVNIVPITLVIVGLIATIYLFLR